MTANTNPYTGAVTTTTGEGRLAVKLYKANGDIAIRRMAATKANLLAAPGQAEMLATAPSVVRAQVVLGFGRSARILADTNR